MMRASAETRRTKSVRVILAVLAGSIVVAACSSAPGADEGDRAESASPQTTHELPVPHEGKTAHRPDAATVAKGAWEEAGTGPSARRPPACNPQAQEVPSRADAGAARSAAAMQNEASVVEESDGGAISIVPPAVGGDAAVVDREASLDSMPDDLGTLAKRDAGQLVLSTSNPDCRERCVSGHACENGQCLDDGDECRTNSDCRSGACTAFFADADGDGYGAGPEKKLCGTSVSGYSPKAGDCCDAIDVPAARDIHPGQVRWFTSSAQCADMRTGYDYDCSGAEEREPVSVVCDAERDPGCASREALDARGELACGSLFGDYSWCIRVGARDETLCDGLSIDANRRVGCH